MASSQVTWSPSDPSLLLVRVAVVIATRFPVTSLYAGLVTQAQAGHDVIKLAVLLFLVFVDVFATHPFLQQQNCTAI